MLFVVIDDKLRLLEEYDEILERIVDHEVLFPISHNKEYIEESVQLAEEFAEKTFEIAALASDYGDLVDDFKDKVNEYKSIAGNPYIIGKDRARRMNRIRDMYHEFRSFLVESVEKLRLLISEDMPENIQEYIRMAEDTFNTKSYVIGVVTMITAQKEMLNKLYSEKIGDVNSKNYSEILNEIVSSEIIENDPERFKEASEIYNAFCNGLELVFVEKEKAEMIMKYLGLLLIEYYE